MGCGSQKQRYEGTALAGNRWSPVFANPRTQACCLIAVAASAVQRCRSAEEQEHTVHACTAGVCLRHVHDLGIPGRLAQVGSAVGVEPGSVRAHVQNACCRAWEATTQLQYPEDSAANRVAALLRAHPSCHQARLGRCFICPGCSIVGKRMQSKDVVNKITDVVANANRGAYRVQVSPGPLKELKQTPGRDPGSSGSQAWQGAGVFFVCLPTFCCPLSNAAAACRWPLLLASRWASGCASSSPTRMPPAAASCWQPPMMRGASWPKPRRRRRRCLPARSLSGR